MNAASLPDHPLVSERVITSERIDSLPAELSALADLLQSKLGTVIEQRTYTITRSGGPDIELPTALVELDDLPGHPLTFSLDELYAPPTPEDLAPAAGIT